jgi:Protein of unknown function, DUF547
MVNIRRGFILICLLSLWSCKEKEKTDSMAPNFVDTTAVMNVDDNELTIADKDTLSIKKDNLIIKVKSKIELAENSNESKFVESKNVTSIKQNTINVNEPSREKPSIKPVTEQVKEIPTEIGKTKVVPTETSKDAEVILINHQLFDTQLKKYVYAGKVNYKTWKKDMTGLQNYLDELKTAKNIEKWPYEEKLVFWINTYNAFTVKLVLDNYPVKSIKDINGGKPWDKRFIQIGSTFYSLNDIENEIIRKKFGEPRIHFALNCAAKSCPILVNKAFTKENLNSLLESNTKSFINGPENTITKDKLEISSIFDWYGSDFDDLVGFIGKYSTTKPNPNAKISFKNYNWTLNE